MKMIINILNEGHISVFNREGPIFGISIFSEMYGVLKQNPELKIEVTTAEEAAAKEKAYFDSKIKQESEIIAEDTLPAIEEKVEIEEDIVEETDNIPSPSIDTADDIPNINNEVSFESAVEIDEFDSAINEILDNTDANDNLPFKLNQTPEKIRKYRESTLQGMKKKDLAKILVDRGYEVGKFSPKYYDTAEKLIAKILKTQ